MSQRGRRDCSANANFMERPRKMDRVDVPLFRPRRVHGLRAEAMKLHAIKPPSILALAYEGWRAINLDRVGIPVANRIPTSRLGAKEDEGTCRPEQDGTGAEPSIGGVRQAGTSPSRAKRLTGWARGLVVPRQLDNDPDIIAARSIVAERSRLQRELMELSDPISNRLRGIPEKRP